MKKKTARWAYLSLTENGIALCSKIRQCFGGDIITLTKRKNGETDKSFDSFGEMMAYAFANYDCLVCVMASGIVVRALAELIQDKTQDPAVLVLDEKGVFCISLLSGHIGGANENARAVAEAIGAQAVITTASDVSGRMAVDTLAEQWDCAIGDMNAAKDITAMIVNSQRVMVSADRVLSLPPYLIQDELDNARDYDGAICVSEYVNESVPVPYVQLIPRNIVIGMGCRKGTERDAILAFIREEMQHLGLHIKSISRIVSADVKTHEAGLTEAADRLGVPFETIPRNAIKEVEHLFTGSAFVRDTIGVSCVAQPCGYLASQGGENLLDIRRRNGMTLSVWKTKQKGI